MAFNNDAGRNGAVAQMQRPGASTGPRGSSRNSVLNRRTPPAPSGRRRIIAILSTILLVVIIFAAIRVSAVANGSNDQFEVHIGSQQTALIDLRQGTQLDPHLLGVNVFPRVGTNSLDKISSGFMNYTPVVTSGLQNMHIKLLRYPGGEWGEQHVLSLEQLSDFSQLLKDTNSDGMLQAHLGGPVKNEQGVPQPANLGTNLNSRADLAGSWVDYMNNINSNQRAGAHAHDPFHAVKSWTIGNEPDQKTSINPLTNRPYTVAEYVAAFIQFSTVMHQNDPTIKVYGPEISQFYGLGAGPFDAGGHPWMEDFLKGVGDYERANHVTLLDGVSFHRYQFDDARRAPGLLLSSSDEWNYLLPQLHQLIKQDLGHDAPIGITEINTNPTHGTNPSRGAATLWWADTLGTLMNQQVDNVAFFSASDVNSPYPLFVNNGLGETAMTRVMQLYTHMQNNLIVVSMQHEPINMFVTEDDPHQTVSLLFVNKSASAQLAQVRPTNATLSVSSWPNLDITLAGYSIVLVTMHRTNTTQLGGAEAYSYIVPTKDEPTAVPLSFTVCGHKSDALANSIPC